MKKLLILILLPFLVWAQTPVFPGGIVTDNQLTVVQNGVQTTLFNSMGATDTSMIVASATGIVPNMILSIDREQVFVCSVSGTSLTLGKSACPNIDGRGFDTGHNSGAATSHVSGAVVSAYIDAWHHNAVTAEIKAVESTLGANLVNVLSASLPVFLATNWTPQTPGTSLTGGVTNVITMTPCPKGGAGTNTNYWVYISGGTGTAEAVTLTGGTCTSGGTTGTWIFTPANSHTGAWTIRSSAAGVSEAVQLATVAGGGQVMFSGTVTTYAKIMLPSNVVLSGVGGSSMIQIATGAYSQFSAWASSGANYAPIQSVVGATNIGVANLIVDTNSANATAPHAGNGGIIFDGVTNSSIRDVTVNADYTSNSGSGGIQIGSAVVIINQCDDNDFRNIRVNGPGDIFTGGGWYYGGIFLQGRHNTVTGSRVQGVTDDGLVENVNTAVSPTIYTYGNTWSHNTYIGNSGALLNGFHTENTTGSQIINNKVFGPVGVGILVSPSGNGTNSAASTEVLVANNIVDSGVGGPVIQGFKVIGLNTYLVSNQSGARVTVTGNQFISVSQYGGVIAYNAYQVNVTGNLFSNSTGYGLLLLGDANYNPQAIIINSNLFYRTNATGAAIFYQQSSTSGSVQPGTDFQINDNIVFDDRSPKLTTVGVAIASSQGGFTPTLTRWQIQNNNFNVLTTGIFGATYDSSCLIGPNLTPDGTNTQAQTPISTAGYFAGGTATLTLVNGANHNINIGNAQKIRIFGPTGGFSVGGFTGGTDGRVLIVWQLASQVMTITNSDASSSAANRILTNTGADVVLRSGISAATFVYDGTSAVWVLTSTN